jgi:UDP-2-acetamido-3-amino-2,3-dideoxy-glucuronate N-acetyltransferase
MSDDVRRLDMRKTSDIKNISVVGCGCWGKNLVRNFHDLGALYAVCDVNEMTLESFKTGCPDLITYTSFSDVLKDPKITGIVLATPAVMHYAMAKDAMLHDKDVFVEKPLSLKIKEGEDLVRLAKERKRILMVGHILYYHKAIIKLKELIGSGELGKIQYIYSNRLNIGRIRNEENILWSFAPHDISVILKLLDEFPTSVCAKGASYLQESISDHGFCFRC